MENIMDKVLVKENSVTVNDIAKAVEQTGNAKLGAISTTYASIHSCPSACPLKESKACYGMQGPISWQWGPLNKRKVSPKDVAAAEVKAIDGLSGERDLRLHTLGDCSTNGAAKAISKAAERYMGKKGKKAFTYTHGWRKVNRKSWGKVSVLASCETPKEVREARKAGYATALVVPAFQDSKAYDVKGLKVIPCPEMTGKAKSCEVCRLCMADDKLKNANVTIAFAAHGGMKEKTKGVLAAKNR